MSTSLSGRKLYPWPDTGDLVRSLGSRPVAAVALSNGLGPQ
jgi:hypothetical protein